jgi:hypothetical protein
MSSTSANKLVSDSHLASEVTKSSNTSKHLGVRSANLTKSNLRDDNLHSRLEKHALKKQNKHKKESSDNKGDIDDDDIGVQLHGVVESVEESKLSSINKKRKVVPSTNINTNSNIDAQSANTKTNNGNKIIKNNDGRIEDIDNCPKDGFNNNSNNKDKDKDNRNNIEYNNKSSTHNNNKSHDSQETHVQDKFKRKKTRSKQKNIRKDNRPDDAKPAYLIPGNDIYRGRELTQVCII